MQGSLTISNDESTVFKPKGLSMKFSPSQTTSSFKRTRAFRIALNQDEDGRIVITSPDLEGLVTDGKDKNEAIINTYEAIEALLESAGENINDLAITLIFKSVV